MAVALVCDPVDKESSHVQIEATHNWDGQKDGQREIPVILPDLFVSFLSRKPQLNPHYEIVRAESEAWISEYVTHLIGLGVPSDDRIIITGNAG